MSKLSLTWRVEQTCTNAWPSLGQVLMGDWLLRFAGGVSRRSNSANPLNDRAGDVDAIVAGAGPLFAAQALPLLFRLPTMVDPAIAARLDGLGFSAEGETITLCADMADMTVEDCAGLELRPRPDAAWLAAMLALQGHSGERATTYRRIVEAIAVPAAFATLRAAGEVVALAYGVVHDGLLCFESVVTAAAHRGRGHGRRLVAGVNAWGRSMGAQAVCLQVDAANAPGLALYRSTGLKDELYRYHYRRAPRD